MSGHGNIPSPEELYPERMRGLVDPECEEVIKREESISNQSGFDILTCTIRGDSWEKQHKKTCPKCAKYPEDEIEELTAAKARAMGIEPLALLDEEDDEDDTECYDSF